MKGGIAAMVVAAEALAATGGLRGDVIVCTNTDEESSGVGALACARRGVRADFAIVPEPSSLEVWPACRGTVYCTITLSGRSGHAEQEHPHWREGGAVNAIDKGRFLLDGVDRLRAEWRSREAFRGHPLLEPPDIVPTRFVADAGWAVTHPQPRGDRPVRAHPARAGRRARLDDLTLRSRLRHSSFAGVRRTRGWPSTRPPSTGTRRSTRPRRRWTPTACWRCAAANRALGIPDRVGGLGSWYDGATFALEAGTPALMYGPRAIDWAHTVDEYVPIDDLVECAQGIAIAGWRLCR